MAQDFNVGAGGAGATYFPIRVAWPTRLNPLNWIGWDVTTSYAPVAKLEIYGAQWIYPYISWHEFGHNMMYRTSNPTTYNYAYNNGPFSVTIPSFASGTHAVKVQQNGELAYNEGFANYFYVMLQKYYNYNFNSYGYVGWENDYLKGCNGSFCNAFPSGNENESRVSTFLYRYTNEALVSASINGHGIDTGIFSLTKSCKINHDLETIPSNQNTTRRAPHCRV